MSNKVYSWEDINLNQFLDIQSILQMTWHNDDRDISKLIDLASIITNEDPEKFENLKISEWQDISNNILGFLTTEINKDYSTDNKFWQDSYYILNGTKYLITSQITDMNTAQYIDYTNQLSINSQDYGSVLACILIPEDKEYGKGYSIEQVKEDITKYLPITKILGLSFFFIYNLNIYIKVSLHYLIQTQKKQLKSLKKPKNQTEIELKQKLEESVILLGTTLSTVSSRLKELTSSKYMSFL